MEEMLKKEWLRLTSENARLRVALTRITQIENEEYGSDWCEIDKARDIARVALNGAS